MNEFPQYEIDRIVKSRKRFSNYYMNIPNKSHYICNDSKTHFRIINPSHFVAQQSRQMSYYVRLFYHYLHVKQLGGLCYFYTLTYNNAALPHFFGVPCFNHDHIQKFFRSSGFDKKLYRDYGFKLQYFVSCELGDGKGSRGIDGNPHYHVIFFLIPDGEQKKVFSSVIFEDMVRTYWCGKNYRITRPENYRYGIAMPGDNYGLVSSPAALSYASKYVLKDTVYKKLVDKLYNLAFFHTVHRLMAMKKARDIYYNKLKFGCMDDPLSHSLVRNYINKLSKRLYGRDIMLRCVPRVRCSQGVGLYALNKVSSDGVHIVLPDPKKGVKNVTIPLYLYRKLYYDVVKDAVGNNKYVLNDAGIELRVQRLRKDIDIEVYEVSSLVDYYKFDKNIYTLENIRLYALYDKVYRNRICTNTDTPLNPEEDFSIFLYSEYFRTNYTDDVDSALRLNNLLSDYCTYDSHCFFSNKLNLFKNLDAMLDEHYLCLSLYSEQRYIDNRRVKQHISKDKFNKYLSSL